MEDARRYYDDFAPSYDASRKTPYHRMIDDFEVELALPYVRGSRVLELGCGTGRILSRLAKVADEAVGVDLSGEMVALARAKGLDARVGDLRALSFENDAFDLTYSFKVLPHVPDIRTAISEAVRVTRPGGHLLLELYNPWSLRYLAKKAAGPQRIGQNRTEADVFTRWDSPRAMRSLIPSNAELVGLCGIRVLTPFAALHRVPVMATGLRGAERLASASPLRYFGGFLVMVLHKS
jgi:ubiquinone/menaquinone biosynthesis C-methylase UbiE